MQKINREQFTELVKQTGIKPRLSRNLRFVPEQISDWEDRELLAVTDRNHTNGVTIIQLDSLYILPFQLLRGISDKHTGRSKPITCDFCYTWQRGGNAGSITFTDNSHPDHTFGFLCCADLHCSLNVRDKTPESILSRAQLHEDLTSEKRIARLKTNLQKIVDTLHARSFAVYIDE